MGCFQKNVLTRFRALLRKRALDTEMDDEMRFHIEMQTQENIDCGMDSKEARSAALRQFGQMEPLKEICREQRGVPWGEHFVQDIRFGVRMLRKNPGTTAAAVLMLALGTAVNAVIFSAVSALIFHPLPYKDPEQLVWLFAANSRYARLPPNWANETFAELRERGQSFVGTALVRQKSFILHTGDRDESIAGLRVSGNIFDLLGIQPILGRAFTREENEWGRHRVVILSYEFWQRRFAGDSNILGNRLSLVDTEVSDWDGRAHDTLEPQTYTVIGVLPAGWQFPIGMGSVSDAWEPESLNPSERQRHSVLDLIIARVKPTLTLKRATAETKTMFQQLRLADARSADRSDYRAEMIPMTDQVSSKARKPLLLLQGATGFVLLLACANIANLLLAKAVVRQREFAVRAALGASRLRLVRQVLTESLLLALLGSAAGLVISFWGMRAVQLLRPSDWPRLNEIGWDWRVLTFCLGVCILSGIAFGFVPALQAAKPDLHQTLKEAGRGSAGGSQRRLRGLLLVSEVAISFVLLVGAGLLVQSLFRLLRVDPGYHTAQVLVSHISLKHPKYVNTAGTAFEQKILDNIEALPGVQSVALASWIPIEGGRERFEAGFQIEGRTAAEVVKMSFVTHNYFKTMGIALVQGRDFEREDTMPNRGGAKIISESFARKYFPGEDPLGKRIGALGGWGVIVGVVHDTLESGLDVPAEPHLYHAGVNGQPQLAIVTRINGESATLASAIAREIQGLDKDQSPPTITPMEEILKTSLAERRFQTELLCSFAVLALLLAALGTYGVMAYSVRQRTREIGVRIALGARKGDVLKLIVQQGMALTAGGLIVGIILALALTRLLASQLFGVNPRDPATFGSVAFLLTVVALFACYLPGRRAAKVSPATSLGCD